MTPTPNNQNNPIPGIDVVVRKKPAGNAIGQSTTDAQGQLTFKQLGPGDYDVVLPRVASGGTVSMTTFVNGKVQSRTDFPAGSSVGTFAVSNAKDTITLKFESNAPAGSAVGSPAKAPISTSRSNK